MDSTSKSNSENVLDSLSNLNVSAGFNAALPDAPIAPNPWQDRPEDILQPTKLTEIHSPEVDSTTYATADSSFSPALNTTAEVLHNFDPLEQGEEKAAREAWSQSEGHPPPPTSAEHTSAPLPKPTSPEPL